MNTYEAMKHNIPEGATHLGKERELEIEAAYDLYLTKNNFNAQSNLLKFNDFKMSGEYKLWLLVVHKTGYRKSLNTVNGKG